MKKYKLDQLVEEDLPVYKSPQQFHTEVEVVSAA